MWRIRHYHCRASTRKTGQKEVRNARSPDPILGFVNSKAFVCAAATCRPSPFLLPGQPAVTRTSDHREFRDVYLATIQSGGRPMGNICVSSTSSRSKVGHRAGPVPFALPSIDLKASSAVHAEVNSQQEHLHGSSIDHQTASPVETGERPSNAKGNSRPTSTRVHKPPQRLISR